MGSNLCRNLYRRRRSPGRLKPPPQFYEIMMEHLLLDLYGVDAP